MFPTLPLPEAFLLFDATHLLSACWILVSVMAQHGSDHSKLCHELVRLRSTRAHKRRARLTTMPELVCRDKTPVPAGVCEYPRKYDRHLNEREKVVMGLTCRPSSGITNRSGRSAVPGSIVRAYVSELNGAGINFVHDCSILLL